ncbi:MAG: ATP-binding protein [Actinomycetota bacterium]|nr:ATP-binding protein [Actinomycetota bacterium]MDQ2956929.1 ATP-binding protein [Actinomycetota bacterium]
MTESVAEGLTPTDTVELTVPADPAYVSVLRTVTASLAARRDFTIDEIDDLRIAVDEASALLLPHAATDASLAAVFGGSAAVLQVVVSVELADDADEADEASRLDQTGFAWMVLAALADTVSTEITGGRLSLALTKTRGARS